MTPMKLCLVSSQSLRRAAQTWLIARTSTQWLSVPHLPTMLRAKVMPFNLAGTSSIFHIILMEIMTILLRCPIMTWSKLWPVWLNGLAMMVLTIRIATTTSKSSTTSQMKRTPDHLLCAWLSTTLEMFINHYILLLKLMINTLMVTMVVTMNSCQRRMVLQTCTQFGTRKVICTLITQTCLCLTTIGIGTRISHKALLVSTKSTKVNSTMVTLRLGRS